MSDSQSETRVLRFDPGARAPTFTLQTKGCQHLSITIGSKVDTVECSVCGATVNPYQALRWLTREWNDKMGRLKQLEDAEARERARNHRRSIRQKIQLASDMKLVAMFPSCQHRGGCSKRSETTGLWLESNGVSQREGRCRTHLGDFLAQVERLEEAAKA